MLAAISTRLASRPLLAQVGAAGVVDPCELALGAIGQHDRPSQLGDQLLHRLADPPCGVRPEGRPAFAVEALERDEQAHDALLHQLGTLDARRLAVEAGVARDERSERVDQLLARLAATLLGGQNERALLVRVE